MYNFTGKISWLFIAISLVFVNSAYAMKRTRENEDLAQLSRAVSSQVLANFPMNDLPDDVLIQILNKLFLEDLAVSLVSKRWLKVAKSAWADFYQFSTTYHECKEGYKKDKNAFNHLKRLRKAYAQLKKHDLSDKEISRLAAAFLAKNFDSN